MKKDSIVRRLFLQFLTRFIGIKPLTTQHSNALAELHAKCFPIGWSAEEFTVLLQDPHTQGVGMSLFGKLIGFCLTRVVLDEAEILTIALHPNARGFKLSAKLLAGSIKQVSRLNARTLFLEVAKTNAPARALYASNGFQEVGYRKGYYKTKTGTLDDALVLSRALEVLPFYVHGHAE